MHTHLCFYVSKKPSKTFMISSIDIAFNKTLHTMTVSITIITQCMFF